MKNYNDISPVDLFRWKVQLLCNGIIIPSDKLALLVERNIILSGGRKTGAGPAGGRYFLLSNQSLVNIQIWIGSHSPNRFVFDDLDDDGKLIVIDNEKDLPAVKLQLIPIPNYYRQLSSDQIPFQKIAVMHGDQTLATTINQRCHLWRTHEECKFCAIEFAIDSGSTIEKKTEYQIIEAIKAARHENPLFGSHLTLTTGNFANENDLIDNYSIILQALKRVFPDILIHIQSEPFQNLEGLKLLKNAGADTIGIHLEVVDEELRKKICPGKSKIPLEMYYQNWDYAVKIFGKNQVSTFILTGFGEDLQFLKLKLEDIIKTGVLPIITPARQIAGLKTIIPTSQGNDMIDLLLYAGSLCMKYNLDPTQNKAGCVKCGGCSALVDAFLLVKQDIISNDD